jgi:hypothetical protein
MKQQQTTYDVFLSSSLAHAKTAEMVARALREAGLDVFVPGEVAPGGKLRDALWQALAESSAFVAVIGPEQIPPANLMVELGAAMAWYKPIYVVHTATESIQLPDYLADSPAYPVSRIDDVVQSIRQAELLSAQDLQLLCEVYAKAGTPTDRLLRQPASLEELAAKFEAASGKRVPGERLVHALIRLRKGGALPRLNRRKIRASSGAGRQGTK